MRTPQHLLQPPWRLLRHRQLRPQHLPQHRCPCLMRRRLLQPAQRTMAAAAQLGCNQHQHPMPTMTWHPCGPHPRLAPGHCRICRHQRGWLHDVGWEPRHQQDVEAWSKRQGVRRHQPRCQPNSHQRQNCASKLVPLWVTPKYIQVPRCHQSRCRQQSLQARNRQQCSRSGAMEERGRKRPPCPAWHCPGLLSCRCRPSTLTCERQGQPM
mmetsp:Transcript_2065/g.5668  ORF Transcript_2065/g.5668 Transcript_2065/m.5668 type:complete len:210 (-) Transcript_2065:1690-2319(-)